MGLKEPQATSTSGVLDGSLSCDRKRSVGNVYSFMVMVPLGAEDMATRLESVWYWRRFRKTRNDWDWVN